MSDLLGELSKSSGFAEFWALYPRKVKKIAAERAYARARHHATHAEIMAGLSAYQFRPDKQFQDHAATWLNGGGWLIEADTTPPNQAQRPSMLERIAAPETPEWMRQRMKELSGLDVIQRIKEGT